MRSIDKKSRPETNPAEQVSKGNNMFDANTTERGGKFRPFRLCKNRCLGDYSKPLAFLNNGL